MDVHDRPAPTSGAAGWRCLGRVTGVAGLAAIVQIFVAVVGAREEPSFTATATEFLVYYRSADTVATPFRSFLFTLGLVTFVWFVVGLSVLLRRAEGEAAWRSASAMGSGVLFVALGLSGLGNEAAVALRAGDLDPQIARYAFDQAQAAFANGRVALGSFAVCCGWVIASTQFLPRWVGWLAIVSGAGLALSRISWTSPIWLVPYGPVEPGVRMMIVGEFRFLRNVIRRHSALPVSAERECLHHRTVSHDLLRTGCVDPKPAR
jgi:hypothetical protein